jgi:hypothetical protein
LNQVEFTLAKNYLKKKKYVGLYSGWDWWEGKITETCNESWIVEFILKEKKTKDNSFKFRGYLGGWGHILHLAN